MLVHQLKGSSSSTGAKQILNICVIMRDCCQAQLQDHIRSQNQALGQALHVFSTRVREALAARHRSRARSEMHQTSSVTGGFES